MPSNPEREQFERRDADLGRLLDAWGQANAVSVEGPLRAPGMEPRWIARFRSDQFEADLMLFYGPVVDVSAFRPHEPDLGYFVGGEEGVSDARFIEMLNDLRTALTGGPDPSWLRLVPN